MGPGSPTVKSFTPTMIARARLDRALVLVGAPLDLALRVALLDRRDHAAELVDRRDVARARALSISSVSASTRVGAAERIDEVGRRRTRSAITCCVRSASRADASVGSASASS